MRQGVHRLIYSLLEYAARTWTSRVGWRSQGRSRGSGSLRNHLLVWGRPLGGAERPLWSLEGGLEVRRPGDVEGPLDGGLEEGLEGGREEGLEGGREEWRDWGLEPC